MQFDSFTTLSLLIFSLLKFISTLTPGVIIVAAEMLIVALVMPSTLLDNLLTSAAHSSLLHISIPPPTRTTTIPLTRMIPLPVVCSHDCMLLLVAMVAAITSGTPTLVMMMPFIVSNFVILFAHF